MQIENQVCSLELAQRLKELNVKQKSLISWQHNPQENRYYLNISFMGDLGVDEIAAFTVAELGELLPDWTESCKRMKDDWICIVRHKHNNTNDHFFGETEADARAKMLIFLLENGLIKK